MLSLTFKNLWARKWRSLMTAVAVIFGIALVAGTYVLTDTTNQAFDQIFTTDKPVIFAYHGYPYLIHRLTYRRTNHDNIHVRGFIEEGTTTTPFDMTVLNELDRYHLALEAIDRVAGLAEKVPEVIDALKAKLIRHHDYVRYYGEDMPEVSNWRWKR